MAIPERTHYHSTDQQIRTAQLWMQGEIADKNVCPPLAGFLSRNLVEGSINWPGIARQVSIVSLYNENPYGKLTLLKKANEIYKNFVRGSLEENSELLTVAVVLPDFRVNRDYDNFMAEFFASQEKMFLENRDLFDRALRRLLEKEAECIVPELSDSDFTASIASRVINSGFRPVYFYGKQINDSDIRDLPLYRGPVDRYKILSRAPYYMFQVVNSVRDNSAYTARMNMNALRQRNTELAHSQDIATYEDLMKRYRKA